MLAEKSSQRYVHTNMQRPCYWPPGAIVTFQCWTIPQSCRYENETPIPNIQRPRFTAHFARDYEQWHRLPWAPFLKRTSRTRGNIGGRLTSSCFSVRRAASSRFISTALMPFLFKPRLPNSSLISITFKSSSFLPWNNTSAILPNDLCVHGIQNVVRMRLLHVFTWPYFYLIERSDQKMSGKRALEMCEKGENLKLHYTLCQSA